MTDASAFDICRQGRPVRHPGITNQLLSRSARSAARRRCGQPRPAASFGWRRRSTVSAANFGRSLPSVETARTATPNGTQSGITLSRNDGPAVRTGERRDGPQVLDGLYCRASAAAVPSHDPHDLNLAGWSAFPSADAERRADAAVPERPQARGGTPWPASATSP
jgi:hypothetical protein